MKILSSYVFSPVILWIASALAQSETTSTIVFADTYSPPLESDLNTTEMKKHKVIPDVIAVAPAKVAKVSYPSGVSVGEGNILTPTQVKDQPSVQWNAEPDAYYTLCMTDPDAPSRRNPKFREWHHWLVGNIPGNDISKGEELSAYIGAAPPQGSGLHRYVFLIYKQAGQLNFTEKKLPNNSGEGRPGFQIRKFAEKYELGDPVAGNFFQAEYDDYVPKVYQQLKG